MFRKMGDGCPRVALLSILSLIGPALVQAQGAVTLQIQFRADTSPPPLGLEVEIEGGEGVRGALGGLSGLHGLTLKRGVVEAVPGGGTAMAYEAELSRETSTGPSLVGDVAVLSQGPADGSQGALAPFLFSVRTDSVDTLRPLGLEDRESGFAAPQEGGGDLESRDVLVWNVTRGSDAGPDVLELRFSPSSDTEQLQGEPSDLFNDPGPGEDLVVLFPEPAPGLTYLEEIRIHRSETSSSPAQIRVKIKHTI